jgi:hypothetical protein
MEECGFVWLWLGMLSLSLALTNTDYLHSCVFVECTTVSFSKSLPYYLQGAVVDVIVW